MADTPRLDLPLIAGEQALKHVTHNEALAALDAIVHLSVEELAVTSPPGSPSEGMAYDVGPSATGDWSGEDGKIAVWSESGWRFMQPAEGWILWDKDSAGFFVYLSSTWTELPSTMSAVQNLDLLGVNTTADATNKFAVRTNAILLTALEIAAAGTGDMRAVLNKEAAGNAASFVFQSAYSGRAEIGLIGDNDFAFKVSPDGSAFETGITIDKDNGYVTLNKVFGSEPSFPTIAGGVLDISTSYCVPAPETGVADTVDTISGGFDGAILVITGTSSVTLTFSDGVGNLKLGGSRVLDNFEDSLLLVQRGGDWIELAYANNG